MTGWNEELVAKLEAERARRRPPTGWGPPASAADIAELVDAVVSTDREGRPRQPRRLRAV